MKVTRTFDDTQWKLVPVEPTPKMILACSHNGFGVSDYRAMLAASPDCPTAEQAPAGEEAQTEAGKVPQLLETIRGSGWTVAVHNDYRLNGKPHTFWLFTKNGRCVKGEGETDFLALNHVAIEIWESPPVDSTLAGSKP